MSDNLTESIVEDAVLAWLESLGWAVKVESRTLAALRNTLLPKLISGELRVNDAEPYIVEATL
jgi:type I restriction enzyme S subunit